MTTVIFASAHSYYALKESFLTKGTKKVIVIKQLKAVTMHHPQEFNQVIWAFSTSKH